MKIDHAMPSAFLGRKVIVRTFSAGVHFGVLARKHGREVELRDCIRLWYWDGAFTLSQLATAGVTKPDNCKFARSAAIELTEAVEVIPCTDAAIASIEAVPEYRP